MFRFTSAILVPNEIKTISIQKANFSGIFSGDDDISALMANHLRKVLETSEMDSLEMLVKTTETLIKEYQFSGSLSLIYQRNEGVYLITKGEGEIRLLRGQSLNSIIKNNNKASGFLKQNDLFVLGFSPFIETLNSESLSAHTPEIIVKNWIGDIISPISFVLVSQEEDVNVVIPLAENKFPEIATSPRLNETQINNSEEQSIEKKRFNFRGMFQKYSTKGSNGKKMTIILAVILLGILIWSVGFGVQRRSHQATTELIKTYKEKIETNLSEAQDLATLNTERSQLLIEEAQKEFNDLKSKVGKDDQAQIQALADEINGKRDTIVGKKSKPAEEFYSLDLISDKAHGTVMDLQGDMLSVLNPDDGEVYELSISQKSKDVIANSSIKNARYISSNDTSVYFYKSDGFYKIDQNDKVSQIIKKDDAWGNIAGFTSFNSNIYAIDTSKNQIYKFLVTDNGYSDATMYLQNTSTNLSSANSIAIDGSVYVGSGSTVYKFTAGATDSFNTVFPNDEQTHIDRVITQKAFAKVYIFDKENGKVYITDKSGQYESQIESSILKNAQDISVDEVGKNIYVLSGKKIYMIGLD